MSKTRKLTTMAMLTALSVILVAVVHFPIIPAATFLEYDPADIPILIGTFVFGPLSGLIITVIAAVIQGVTVSATSSWYGIVMHIIATGTFVLVAGSIYKAKKTKKRAIVGLVSAVIVTAVVAALANLVITPLFTGWPVATVRDMLLPVIIPFNVIKFAVNGVVTFFVYKPISNLVKKPKKS